MCYGVHFKMRNPILAFLAVGLAVSQSVWGDEEAANRPYVRASQSGSCYARAVPENPQGTKGTTTIYAVAPNGDKPLYSFSWYAASLYVECALGSAGRQLATSLVRFGEWPRGGQATVDQLALAFYVGDRLVGQYSTLDVAGSPKNVLASKSHYRVVDRVLGYRWVESNVAVFEIVTTDGRTMTFDPITGDLLSGRAMPR
jgi:hypothetical protein